MSSQQGRHNIYYSLRRCACVLTKEVRLLGNLSDEGSSAMPKAVRSGRTLTLGGGLRVPYPDATSEAASRVARGNRRSETKPEFVSAWNLHRRGLRFRKDLLIKGGNLKVHPDIVFPRSRVAVFVDGCFWHSCPDHHVRPSRNREYWVPK